MQNLNSPEEQPINAAFALKLPCRVAREVTRGFVTIELTFDTPDSLSLPGACWVNLCGMRLARDGSWHDDLRL